MIRAFRASTSASPSLAEADLALFSLIHPWVGEAANPWLADKLEARGSGFDREAMARLADALDDDRLRDLVGEATGAMRRFDEPLASLPEAEAERLHERKEASVAEELRHRFAAALRGH